MCFNSARGKGASCFPWIRKQQAAYFCDSFFCHWQQVKFLCCKDLFEQNQTVRKRRFICTCFPTLMAINVLDKLRADTMSTIKVFAYSLV